MPKDRKVDRHRDEKPGRLIRPDPPELWDQLGAIHGRRGRNAVISDLIARYLRGDRMPPLPQSDEGEPAPVEVPPATFSARTEPPAPARARTTRPVLQYKDGKPVQPTR